MLKALRWGDNDRYFGPFTWSWSDSYPHWSVTLRSAGEEGGEGGQCSLRLHFGKATLIVALPGIIRPWREKRQAHWDAETIKRMGRDWYWSVYPRRYGFSYSDGFLSVYFGRETMDSSTDQRWGYFLPWTQWRHVRHALYDLKGVLYETIPEKADWDTRKLIEKGCPTARFSFEDYDGQCIVATTRIEEREWRFGAGYFKWLSWFRRPKISRALDISFSDEVGPEKGSWKGGTIGHSIEMLPGELHEAAFRRYCEQEHRAKGRRYRIKFLMPA